MKRTALVLVAAVAFVGVAAGSGAAAPGDATPPTVTAVSPPELATAAPAASNLTATFSERMRAATINANSFQLVKRNPDGTTTPVGAAVTYMGGQQRAVLDPSSPLTPGDYTARVTTVAKDLAGNRLDQDPAAAGSQPRTWKFRVGAAGSSVRDGKILVNGEPFFPFGFYHGSYNESEDARQISDLREISAAGFNTMHVALENNDGRAFLDEARSLGVRVVIESNDANGTPSTVRAFKGHPATFGWSVADDVDNGRKTPEQIRAMHDEIKAADPSHITYGSGGYPTRIGNFMNVSDTLGMQSYPVPYEDLNSTDYSISSAVNAAEPYDRPIIANLQSFAWPGQRAPDAEEARNMTYQALMNGVDGIVYYTYYGFGSANEDIHNHPELWEALKSLVPEIEALNQVLLKGRLTKNISTGDESGYVEAARWSYDGKVYVAVANTSSTETYQLSIPLPAGVIGPAQPLFAGRPDGMSFQNGKLTGPVNPKDVHVYVLEDAS